MQFVESSLLCLHLRPPETFLFFFHLPEYLLALPFPPFVCDKRCHPLNQVRLLDQQAGIHVIVEEDFL